MVNHDYEWPAWLILLTNGISKQIGRMINSYFESSALVKQGVVEWGSPMIDQHQKSPWKWPVSCTHHRIQESCLWTKCACLMGQKTSSVDFCCPRWPNLENISKLVQPRDMITVYVPRYMFFWIHMIFLDYKWMIQTIIDFLQMAICIQKPYTNNYVCVCRLVFTHLRVDRLLDTACPISTWPNPVHVCVVCNEK